MSYVAGFVAAVPTEGREAYLRYAAAAAVLFKEFGATRCVECWQDDVPEGKTTDFYRAVKAEPGESVVFSWIEYPSRQVYESSMKMMMEDPRMAALGDLPFDGRRMIYGGFSPIVDV